MASHRISAREKAVACGIVAMLLLAALAGPLIAQRARPSATAVSPRDVASRAARRDDSPANVLSPAEWERVNRAVDRALSWLASQQQSDGSFPTLDLGQPGVTCLCTLAFMAHGHVPGEGPYGAHLERATEYALGCQKENGLITLLGPDGPEIIAEH